MKQISVILIGAGSRGKAYCGRMKNIPDQYKIVAVADPMELKRRSCQAE